MHLSVRKHGVVASHRNLFFFTFKSGLFLLSLFQSFHDGFLDDLGHLFDEALYIIGSSSTNDFIVVLVLAAEFPVDCFPAAIKLKNEFPFFFCYFQFLMDDGDLHVSGNLFKWNTVFHFSDALQEAVSHACDCTTDFAQSFNSTAIWIKNKKLPNENRNEYFEIDHSHLPVEHGRFVVFAIQHIIENFNTSGSCLLSNFNMDRILWSVGIENYFNKIQCCIRNLFPRNFYTYSITGSLEMSMLVSSSAMTPERSKVLHKMNANEIIFFFKFQLD